MNTHVDFRDTLNSTEAMLLPTNKKERTHLERMIKHLGLKTKGEIFILNCVLHLDWRRQIIIQNIDFIEEKVEGSICFRITLTAPSMTTHYSTGCPYREEGWSLDSLDERMNYTYNQMRYYLKKH